MKHAITENAKRICAALTAMACAFALAACSSSSSSFSMTSKMDNTIEVKSENADPDTSSDGNIVIQNGEALVVESAITAGALNVKVVNAEKGEDGAPDAEQEFAGTSTDEIALPGGGEYKVICSSAKDGTTGTLKMYAKASENAAAEEAAEEDAARTAEVSDGAEENPLIQAAAAIDDDLAATWGDSRNVSYTLEENTVYIQVWEEGINTETIKDVNNWEDVKQGLLEDYDIYADIMNKTLTEEGHLYLQFVSDAQDKAFFSIVDGEVVYDVFADENAAGAEIEEDEESGYLALSVEEQKPLLAEFLGCKPENLEFVDNGTYDDKEPVAIYRHVDAEGNESDIRILLFDDGTVFGFTPENEVIEVKNYFAE